MLLKRRRRRAGRGADVWKRLAWTKKGEEREEEEEEVSFAAGCDGDGACNDCVVACSDPVHRRASGPPARRRSTPPAVVRAKLMAREGVCMSIDVVGKAQMRDPGLAGLRCRDRRLSA